MSEHSEIELNGKLISSERFVDKKLNPKAFNFKAAKKRHKKQKKAAKDKLAASTPKGAFASVNPHSEEKDKQILDGFCADTTPVMENKRCVKPKLITVTNEFDFSTIDDAPSLLPPLPPLAVGASDKKPPAKKASKKKVATSKQPVVQELPPKRDIILPPPPAVMKLPRNRDIPLKQQSAVKELPPKRDIPLTQPTVVRDLPPFRDIPLDPPSVSLPSSPLSVDPPGSEKGLSPIVENRNSLARIAIEAPPIDKQDPPQDSFFSKIIQSVGDLAKTLDDGSGTDVWIEHIENIAIFSYQMYKARTFDEIFVAVTAYVKMYMKSRSIIVELMKLINGIPDMQTKESEVIPESDELETPSWSRSMRDKWILLRTNTVFNKISYLISAAMSLTICSLKEITWSPFGVKLIHLEASKKHSNAFDIIDAIVETFNWMAETGWQVFHTGSLAPILYSDQAMVEYNANFDYVQAHAPAALSGNVEDLGAFEKKVDSALRKTGELQKVKPDQLTALWLQNRYASLVKIKERLIGKNRNTQLRVQPIGFSLHGGTAVGKTTLGKLTMNTSLKAMGYDISRARQVTHDPYDNFQSTYTSDIEGLFLDDVANLKSDFAQGTQIPSAAIIKFFNNVAAQAVKAEINEKGVVFINFKCGVITTNTKELDARVYSNCPESILRRLYHVHVQIKPEYRVKGGSSLDTEHPKIKGAKITNDIWTIDVERCISSTSPTTGKSALRFEPISILIDGQHLLCTNLDLDSYLRVVVQLSKDHKIHQDNLIQSNYEFEEIPFCKCTLPYIACKLCKDIPLEQIVKDANERTLRDAEDKKQALIDAENVRQTLAKQIKPQAYEKVVEVIASSVAQAARRYVSSWLSPVGWWNSLLGYSPIETISEMVLIRKFQAEINNYATPALIAITPDFVYNTSYFKDFTNLWICTAATRDLKHHAYALSTLTGLGFLGCLWYRRPIVGAIVLGGGWYGTVNLWGAWCARKELYEKRFVDSRTAMSTRVKMIRDAVKPSTILCGATLVIGVKLLSLWNQNRMAMMPNASMTPEQIDAQPGWFGFMLDKIGLRGKTQPASTTADTAHVVTTIEKNLMFVEITRDDGITVSTNIFFPRSGVAWIPRHNLYPGCDMGGRPTTRFSAVVHRSSKVGGKFSFKADSSTWYEMPNLDMLAVYVPNCPDLKDLTKWLPLEVPKGSAQAIFKRRARDLSFVEERLLVTMDRVGHKYMNFDGGRYYSSFTGAGACMSALVKDGKNPFIMGYHIGGGDAQLGVMQTVTLAMAKDCFAALSARSHIILSANAGIFPQAQYGRAVIDGPTHPKAHVNSYTSENYIEVLGACKVRRTQKSTVQQSAISEFVTKECGVDNKWGPPAMKENWKPFNVTLDQISQPSDSFYPQDLLRAREDFLKPLKPLIIAHAKRDDTFRPLDDHEMVCGVNGKRFLDAIPMDTSMGFPLFGPKNRYFKELREDQRLITRQIGADVRAEMDRLMTCWKAGERGYPVMSACLKDEPTKKGKTKVRVFMACPVAFGLYIRKYFLPLARFFGLHPLESEMAVGVNAFGPQWGELCAHMRQYANDGEGLFGMDYTAYDASMNSQVTKDSLSSMIELARWGGYSEDDLHIMEMMVADLTHPVVEINGTLVMVYAMNPSGNNITVQLNCLANSKYIRLAAFSTCPEQKNFRDFVSLMTYGDDNSGSVKQAHRARFNFITIKEYLQRYGMTITPPDKESEGQEFFEADDLDFLKRQSVYIPEIGHEIGALSEMSIFKSLHSNLKSSSCTPREVAVSCIETAMHEWFAHGRKVYTMRAAQMGRVCQQSNLIVPSVDATFDDRVDRWKENYCKVAE